jgi:hypothetical protein
MPWKLVDPVGGHPGVLREAAVVLLMPQPGGNEAAGFRRGSSELTIVPAINTPATSGKRRRILPLPVVARASL